jgi:GNAT superfamily N-acetyltransferase
MRLWQSIRRVGFGGGLQRLGDELWNVQSFYELRCDLRPGLVPVASAKMPITMRPVEARTFKGFHNELARCDRSDYLKLLLRNWYCRAGVGTLYVAFDGDEPVYAQWLATPEDQRRIPPFLPGRFPALRSGELLLEGAYTFAAYRRLGLMREGMAQLLGVARERGAPVVVTYVDFDNIGSLRGCADVGFVPDEVRVSTRRIVRWTKNRPVREPDWRAWEAATAKRPSEQAVSPLSSPSTGQADRGST